MNVPTEPRGQLQAAMEEINIIGHAIVGVESEKWDQGMAWSLQGMLDRIVDRMGEALGVLESWTPPVSAPKAQTPDAGTHDLVIATRRKTTKTTKRAANCNSKRRAK